MMKNRNNNTSEENRQRLAIAIACRRYLYLNGFLSEAENDNIHKRILMHQSKLNIKISEEQIESVVFGYEN